MPHLRAAVQAHRDVSRVAGHSGAAVVDPNEGHSEARVRTRCFYSSACCGFVVAEAAVVRRGGSSRRVCAMIGNIGYLYSLFHYLFSFFIIYKKIKNIM